MAVTEEEKRNTYPFWFIIVPICVFLILAFFLYALFNANSIQVASTKKVFEIVKKLKHTNSR